MPLLAHFVCDGAGCDASQIVPQGVNLRMPDGWVGDKSTGKYYCPTCAVKDQEFWQGFIRSLYQQEE